MSKPKVLWVGDAGCDSGFARCTHAILDSVREAFDVFILGMNYRGDPHNYPYRMYPCWAGGDMLGYKRIAEIVNYERPEIIVFQNDPWNIPGYIKALKKGLAPGVSVITVGAIAVDSKNARGAALNELDHVIFWTDFAKTSAERGGYKGTSTVIGLGVEREKFFPGDKLAARKLLGIPEKAMNAFILGNVNRNQPRKRIDLTMLAFAKWYHAEKPDAYLYLHSCPTGDVGIDVNNYAHYLGLNGRVFHSAPEVWRGLTDEYVRLTYQSFDAQINSAIGEGWGLTTLEGMACRVAQLGGGFAALGEWPRGSMLEIPVREEVAPSPLNQVGGVIDTDEAAKMLRSLYNNRWFLNTIAERGFFRAQDPEFDWRRIGEEYNRTLRRVLDDAKRSAVQIQPAGSRIDEEASPQPSAQDAGRDESGALCRD